MRTARFEYWRALLDGKCHVIHKSENQCWESLRRGCQYEAENHDRWIVEAVEQELPVIPGRAIDLGATGGVGGVHIFWQCPYCEIEHCCDHPPDDQSPYLWFCERDRGIVAVEVPV